MGGVSFFISNLLILLNNLGTVSVGTKAFREEYVRPMPRGGGGFYEWGGVYGKRQAIDHTTKSDKCEKLRSPTVRTPRTQVWSYSI